MINAIPKIYTLGHRHTAGILEGEVRIQEKIDGSQFSFGMISTDGVPIVECRSKGAAIPSDAGMFAAAVETVRQCAVNGQLPIGWVFQCEYLAKPKHNVLAYSCIPAGHLVLFDVRNAQGEYLPDEVDAWAKTLGIQPVPTLWKGDGRHLVKPEDASSISVFDHLEHNSILGGCKIEGVVIKNYGKPHPDSASGFAPMTAKIVSERFKEKHASGPINPKHAQSDIEAVIVARYRTEARWLKAIQHLKEAGKLVNGPEDIGPLLAEIQQDLQREEWLEIAEAIAEAHWKAIARGVCAGFPEYYKKLLAGEPSVWQDLQINKNENEKENN